MGNSTDHGTRAVNHHKNTALVLSPPLVGVKPLSGQHLKRFHTWCTGVVTTACVGSSDQVTGLSSPTACLPPTLGPTHQGLGSTSKVWSQQARFGVSGLCAVPQTGAGFKEVGCHCSLRPGTGPSPAPTHTTATPGAPQLPVLGHRGGSTHPRARPVELSRLDKPPSVLPLGPEDKKLHLRTPTERADCACTA